MASVPLRFIPPGEPGIVTLHIWESPTKTGSFSEIDSTPAGTYPNYIDRFTTNAAASATNWFAIQWQDAGGARSELSAPVQGGTETLVGILVQRMLLRDSSLNEIIAAQEAEAAISDYYGVFDPSTIDPATVSPKILEGLTLLALGWSYMVVQSTSSTAQKFTAGLISLDAGSSSSRTTTNSEALIKLAEKMLGRGFSRILHLKDDPVSLGYTRILTADLSRTMIEI